MLPDDKIAVLGVDNVDKKFFDTLEDEIGCAYLSVDKYIQYREFMESSGKKFSREEVHEMAKSRSLSEMREFLLEPNLFDEEERKPENGKIK